MRAAPFPAHVRAEVPLQAVLVLSCLLLAQIILSGGAQAQNTPAHVPPVIVDTTNSLAPAPLVDRSLNWSGYVAKQGSYTAVSGSWLVPKVESHGKLAADATWVGIGGTNTDDLIQAGTQAITDENGVVMYQAWMEGLPGGSVSVPLEVHPGDLVSVELAESSPGEWSVTMRNETTGKQYHTTVAYKSVHASAEWIEEMPSSSVFIPLDNFESVHFLSASAVKDGETVTPQQALARPVAMLNGTGEALATPSILSESGDSFRVEREAAQASPMRGAYYAASEFAQ